MDNKHIFERVQPDMCNICNVRFTSKHAILFCPKYNNLRTTLLSYIRKENLMLSMDTILNDYFPIHILLDFLKNSGIINLL